MRQLLLGLLALSACGSYEENLGRTRDVSARWAVAVGTRQEESGRGIAIDSIGDVIAAGYQNQSNGQQAGFVTKRVASDGSERWTTKFMPLTPGSRASAGAVAIAPGDAVLVVGSIQGSVEVAGQTFEASYPPGGGAEFLAKFSSAGQLEWLHMLDHVGVTAVAIADDGRTYVAGAFSGPLTIAGTTLSSSSSENGGVLVALDPDGVPLWGHAFIAAHASNAMVCAESMTIAPNGDVLVVGQFYGATAFGGPVLAMPAGTSLGAFVTRFRADGLYLASSVVPPSGFEQSLGLAVAIDPAGSTVVLTQEASPSQGKDAVKVVHVLDDALDQLWVAEANGPIAFTDDGALLTAEWRDGPTVTPTGALQLSTVDASGVTWSGSVGSRVVYAPRLTFIRAATARTGRGVALLADLTGTLEIAGTELAAVGGQQNDIDALLIMLDP